MIASMGAACRSFRSRLAMLAVVAGGALLALPSVGLAADWSPTVEPIPGSSHATSVATEFGSSSALTAVWDDPAMGIVTSVRSAANRAWSAETSISTDSGASAPSVAVAANDDAVATWIGADSEVYASLRTGGSWSSPIALAPGDALSPQAAFGGSSQIPSVFWISNNSVQTATWNGVGWTVSTPSGATPPSDQTLTNLRVAISSNGSGAAAWVRDDGTAVHIDSAQISPGVSAGVWSAGSSTPLSDTANASSTVAVAANAAGLAAVAWSEPAAGTQVAISTGSGFAVAASATISGSDQPALVVDSSGRIFVSARASGSVKARIRATNGTWGTAATLGSGIQSTDSLSADATGDVVASWATGARAEIEAYDATAPVLTVHPPVSPSIPGPLAWSVTSFDLWSPVDATTAHWTFTLNSANDGSAVGESVTHPSPTPGTATGTVSEADDGGNVGTQSASVTVPPDPPHNTAIPVIDNASSAADLITLTSTPGSWSGTPTPGVVSVWQRCTTSSSCTTQQTGGSFTLSAADVGSTIRILETATNGGGTQVATSLATPVVAPISTDTPQVLPASGLADGDVVSASSPQSDWDGASGLTFDYRFQRCTPTCNDVQTGGSSTYQLMPNDVGQKIRVIVQAKSGPAGGPFSTPVTSTSPLSSVVAPTARSAPSVTGGTEDGQTLTAVDADWGGVAGLNETFTFSSCDVGGSCTVMQSGGGTTYLLTGGDMGKTIKLTVQASKGSSAPSTSPVSPGSAVISPHSTGVPSTPSATVLQDGGVLNATNGSWLDLGLIRSFSYQWVRCLGTACNDISGATDQNYSLTAADVGQKMHVKVSAHVLTGATETTSLDTGVVAPLSTGPSVITLPSVVQDKQVFTVANDAWDGVSGLSLTYQWLRCDQTGALATCQPVATGSQYTSGPADVGQTLRAIVSASKNSSTIVPSDSSAPTPAIAPFSTSAPTLTGTPTDGQILTAAASSAAAWDSTPTMLTFAYVWLRCDVTGNACVAIPGGTGTTYTLTPDDVSAADDPTHARHEIRLQVTATASGASATAQSAATAVIGAITTRNTTAPQVTGGQYSNQTLTSTLGVWTGTDIEPKTYQWVACVSPFDDATCTNVGTANATSSTYLVQPSDIGKWVSARVTVVNRAGDIANARAAFGPSPVMTNPLAATLGPVVSGAYIDGAVLTTTDGEWSPPDGLVFSHTWLRCPPNPDGSAPDGSASCPRVKDATAANYTLTAADVGQYVVSRVEADVTTPGSIGISATQDSDVAEACSCDGAPRPVAAAPPVNTGAPTIAGAAKQGIALAASPGTWAGTNGGISPMTFAYQWQRCDQTGASCQAIAGATQTSYTTTAQDAGFRLVVRVTATNKGGTQVASSAPTDVIVASVVQVSGGGGAGATPSSAPPIAGSISAGGVHANSLKTDKTAPKLTLAFVGGGTLLGGTTLRVNVSCPKTEQTCKARLQLVATLRKPTGKAHVKPTTIGGVTLTLKGGQTRLMKLKLSSAARTLLKQTLKLKVTLMANVTDAAGNVTPKETKGITLRWKKA
jgi:hypothetical protein